MQLRTEIAIDAPPEAVWRVLVDTKRYHEWNPFITLLDGPLEDGAELTVVVSPPGASDFRFRPRVVRCEVASELRWQGKLLAPWLLSGEHFFELRPQPDGSTRFVHGENFQGYLTRLIATQLTATARGSAFMNQALKRRVESGNFP